MIGHGLKVWGDLIKFNKVFQKKNLINDNKIWIATSKTEFDIYNASQNIILRPIYEIK